MNKVFAKDLLSCLANSNLGFEYLGDPELEIRKIVALEFLSENTLSFCRYNDPEYLNKYQVDNSLIIIRNDFPRLESSNRSHLLLVDNPDLAICILGKNFQEKPEAGVHPSAIISPSAIVHPTASIGAHVFLGDDVSVGAGVIVEELSSLKNCTVADGSHIFPGVRVGSSGLGSHRDLNGTLHHFPHFCKVQIGRNVLVQDNSTIARGTLKDTILEDGVVVGPLSWIAHSVHLQPNVFVGQSVTIAGSVSVGKDTQIWSHAAIKDGLIIGESCVVGMGSVVTHNIPSNTRVFGNPAKPR